MLAEPVLKSFTHNTNSLHLNPLYLPLLCPLQPPPSLSSSHPLPYPFSSFPSHYVPNLSFYLLPISFLFLPSLSHLLPHLSLLPILYLTPSLIFLSISNPSLSSSLSFFIFLLLPSLSHRLPYSSLRLFPVTLVFLPSLTFLSPPSSSPNLLT